MTKNEKLINLVDNFKKNISYYKDSKKTYNEHQCRIEYIDPLLEVLGWDVSNKKFIEPQYREVIGENYSNQFDRPDYTLTLRGESKIFVEAKKPSVDVYNNKTTSFQCRKYGWNAKHKLSILTNFEYLIIYDTNFMPKLTDNSNVARYRSYHYTEYVSKLHEIESLISRDVLYSGEFDKVIGEKLCKNLDIKQQVDFMFLKQINNWRILLSNELYNKDDKYKSLEILNEVVQSFINKIVFLRICEDKNLPTYCSLQHAISDKDLLHKSLEELFRQADKKYNSGIFSGEDIIFDLNSDVVIDMIEGLYYPQSPYMFNIIKPNLLGKIYEMFLTEQLVLNEDGFIILVSKKTCANRSIVTTPTEIVNYMVEETLSRVCFGKKPQEILDLKIADIACGSGIFLEKVFSYLQMHCVNWYLENNIDHILGIDGERFKLPFEEKKIILTNCIYGIDLDSHAVEVAKFSLLIKLIEDETTPSIEGVEPILPDLSQNIFYGNSLISENDIKNKELTEDDLFNIVPLNWSDVTKTDFNVIIGNPPYVNTESLHLILPNIELQIYKEKYDCAYKQFDKYFIFLQRALKKVAKNGYVCYIIPNKFFKIDSGEKLREFIAYEKTLIKLDDFGDVQLFEDKTIYSCIALLQNKKQETFEYSHISSPESLWLRKYNNRVDLNIDILGKKPWRLTTDIDFLSMLKNLEEKSVHLSKHANIFNGIQTSAERPVPIYWFSLDEVVKQTNTDYYILRDEICFKIEKSILKEYFKPVMKNEKGLNSYSSLSTNKLIIFPYDIDGKLIDIDVMKKNYPGTYHYLEHYYSRLVPKCVSSKGIRDVKKATKDTWYQYGRTQGLTSFINTDKLIVGILSKEAMYIYDRNNMLISSGGTAGYCAITKNENSPYALEYIQAWVTHPLHEKIIGLVGSDFENGFVARGTYVLQTMPFVELNFSIKEQKDIHDKVVELSHEIYTINDRLLGDLPKKNIDVLYKKKSRLIKNIEKIIESVYNLDFNEVQI